MKIQRHNDGTYSITGMTRNDFSELVYAEVCAAASSRTFNGIDAEGIETGKVAQAASDRLYSVLAAMERGHHSGSIIVTSANRYGDENAFLVEKINKVEGWGGEDITSHLKRAGFQS